MLELVRSRASNRSLRRDGRRVTRLALLRRSAASRAPRVRLLQCWRGLNAGLWLRGRPLSGCAGRGGVRPSAPIMIALCKAGRASRRVQRPTTCHARVAPAPSFKLRASACCAPRWRAALLSSGAPYIRDIIVTAAPLAVPFGAVPGTRFLPPSSSAPIPRRVTRCARGPSWLHSARRSALRATPCKEAEYLGVIIERSRGGEARASREGNGGRGRHVPRERHDSRTTALPAFASLLSLRSAPSPSAACAPCSAASRLNPCGARSARPGPGTALGAAHAGAPSPAMAVRCCRSLSVHALPTLRRARTEQRSAPLPSAPTRARTPRPWPELAASASS